VKIGSYGNAGPCLDRVCEHVIAALRKKDDCAREGVLNKIKPATSLSSSNLFILGVLGGWENNLFIKNRDTPGFLYFGILPERIAVLSLWSWNGVLLHSFRGLLLLFPDQVIVMHDYLVNCTDVLCFREQT